MPILGIIASSISGNLEAGDFESIATVSVTSGTSTSLTFTSISGTYTHLQVRGIARLSGGNGELDFQFNSDTSTNYSYHRMYGNGSSVASEAATSTTQATVGYYTAGTSVFNGMVVDILDYANTNKYKTVRSLNGMDTNGAGIVPSIAAQPDETRTDMPAGELAVTSKDAVLIIPVEANIACVTKRSFSAGCEPFCNQLGGFLSVIISPICKHCATQ